MNLLIRAVFAIGACALVLVAGALLLSAPFQVLGAALSGEVPAREELLSIVGYLIVAMALIDVAKYFFEEEVPAGRDKRTPADARRGLTKFLTTMIIAIFLEGLVLTFETARSDMTKLLYPALLVGAGCLALLTLGLFQRLSTLAEREVGPAEAAEARRDPAG
ncbi:GNAT family acetyltransferase [Ancylobacter lacus]|uniref:GNAT family acetyltransferase n=1 Tax=Ancylobacter lacus TaxID=2579970 RepID=UPI001BCAED36|nr:GNAT family acetyltransferase [Ancylobacter lacus]MBS7537630.1 GNAT family acetyltransferase [Ancylobacter lacus]